MASYYTCGNCKHAMDAHTGKRQTCLFSPTTSWQPMYAGEDYGAATITWTNGRDSTYAPKKFNGLERTAAKQKARVNRVLKNRR